MDEKTSFNDFEKSKKKEGKKAARGKPHRMILEKLDDGTFTSELHHKVNPTKEMSYMLEAHRHVTGSHKTAKDAAKHFINAFGGDREAGAPAQSASPDAAPQAAAETEDE